MRKQAYQVPELRDASNTIIQQGTYGRTSPLVNADNTGVLDYVNNNLEALHDAVTSGTGVRAAADTKGTPIDIEALKQLIIKTIDQAKQEAKLEAHPIGSYYFSNEPTSPADLFGGTWQMLDPGLTLISQGKGTDDFGNFEFVAGQTYGERMHQLIVDELPSVTGTFACSVPNNHESFASGCIQAITYEEDKNTGVAQPGSDKQSVYGYELKLGGSKSYNNLPTSRAVYIWFRVS